MKKTLLALAIPAVLAAGSASAVTLLDDGTTTLEMDGAIEIQYRQRAYEEANSQAGKIRMDDGNLKFTVAHKTSGELTAFAVANFEYSDDDVNVGENDQNGYSTNGGVQNDQLYVGLEGDFGTVTFGKKNSFSDGRNPSTDIELNDAAEMDLGNEGVYEQLIEYVYTGNGLTLGAGYNLTQDNDSNAAIDTNATDKTAEFLELKAGYKLTEELEATLFYTLQNGANSATTTTGDKYYEDNELQSMALKVTYNAGDLYLGLGITSQDYDNNDDALMQYGIYAAYQVNEKVKVGAGFGFDDADESNTGTKGMDSRSSTYVNVQYALAKNTRIYAGIGTEDYGVNKNDAGGNTGDATGEDSGLSTMAGLELKF